MMEKKGLRWMMPLMITGLCVFGVSELFPQSEKILARIGEKVITQSYFDEVMKRFQAFRKEEPYSLDEKKNLLNMLVKNSLVIAEAEREKLDEKPEIQSKIKMYRDELLTREYIATKIEPLVTVKDEEVEAILKQNPNLVPKERVMLREIRVRTEKEAEEIYRELKNGADFSKIAKEKSIARSKTDGGLLGSAPKEQLAPFVAEAVSPLKEGEFSKPIKTEEGFLILYLVNRQETPPEQMKILGGKVREKIFQLEKNKKIEAMIEKKIEELKKQIKVETYFDQLK
ncbi:MAG: peptidylprolyl isomerase [Thermodesulfobacteriota bacterium]